MAPELLDDLPVPQRLALAYAPARARARTLALLALDARLAAVLSGRLEPIAKQLRLAWWRETLAQPAGTWPRGEPLLEALSAWHDPAALAQLPGGWEVLLADQLGETDLDEFVAARARAFVALAEELGETDGLAAASAARIWACADLAANLSAGAERKAVVELGRRLGKPARLPRSLRPLAVLAGLGAAALERGGAPLVNGPGAALLALRIGLMGR